MLKKAISISVLGFLLAIGTVAGDAGAAAFNAALCPSATNACNGDKQEDRDVGFENFQAGEMIEQTLTDSTTQWTLNSFDVLSGTGIKVENLSQSVPMRLTSLNLCTENDNFSCGGTKFTLVNNDITIDGGEHVTFSFADVSISTELFVEVLDLNFDSGNGDAPWKVTITPLPAAVWMFIAALGGLFGLRRWSTSRRVAAA